MIYKAKEYREERAGIVQEMHSLVTKAKEENRELTADEEKRWNELDAKGESLLEKAERIEKQEKLDAEMKEKAYQAKQENKTEKSQEEKEEICNRVFQNWLRRGVRGLNEEESRIFENNFQFEKRDVQGTADAAGGYTIPEGFGGRIIATMKQWGGMMQVANVFNTNSGNPIPWPTNDDTANVGAYIDELEDVSVTDPGGTPSGGATAFVFGTKTLNAHTLSSKTLVVPRQLIQDTGVDLIGYLTSALGVRMGRAANNKFTVGAAGQNFPVGVVTEAPKGADFAAAALTFVNLVDLEHSIDPAYRASKNCRYMFNDATLKILKKILDSDGRPIFQASVVAGEPGTINGYPYTINQDVANVATTNKSVLFGDFSYYYIRQVLGIQMQRLEEKYAENFAVGFVAFARHDGKLMDTAAVKHGLHA